jgi:hypothetical protein
MRAASGRLLLWSPRVLGILVSLFFGVFALDALSPGTPFVEALPGFLLHLVPAAVLLAIVGVSWRREWIGGTAFVGLAVLYATTMARGRIDWMLVISGSLMVVGVLFLWSWRHRRAPHGS